jgi:hypothetical protein
MAQVFRATGTQRDDLLETLAKADPLLDAAAAGAAGSMPIGSALDYFQAEHQRLVNEVALRVDSALYHGQEAVEAYVRGDVMMAEQYGRASVVFAGDRLPPDMVATPNAVPAPDPQLVQGG